MNINEEKRNQWQALKGMGFKAHWDYFWDYYKVHVLVAVIGIAFVVMLIKDITNNLPFAVNAIFINANSMQTTEALEAEFAEHEGIDTKEADVSIDVTTTLSLTAYDSMNVTTGQKIYAMIAANDLDLMMADSEVFENYAKNEVFEDLRNYLSEDELSSLGDKVFYVDQVQIDKLREEKDSATLDDVVAEETAPAEYVFERKDPSEMEQPVPVGIIMEGNKTLTDLECYYGTTPIAGIVTGTQRGETAADLIRFLLNK